MKKFFAMILAAAMIFVLVSCGNPDKPEETTGSDSSNTTADTQKPEDTTAPEETTAEPEVPQKVSALDVLNTIWNAFAEDEKFAAMGGDFSEENMTDGAPGKYSIEDAAMLDSTLGIPEGSVPMIDEAASLMHMMNANTFTGAAYHMKDAANMATLAAAIKDNIVNRQWICGFPDTLVIISVGDCLVTAFGNEELIESFKTKTLAAFDGAKLLYEERL